MLPCHVTPRPAMLLLSVSLALSSVKVVVTGGLPDAGSLTQANLHDTIATHHVCRSTCSD